MAGQDREGGAFFFNNRKSNPNQPDYRGELRVTREVVMALQEQLQKGVQFPAIELAGWKKNSASGTTFISLNGKKPYEKGNAGGSGQSNQGSGQWPPQGQAYGAPQGGAPAGGIDDGIPF
jgi:uncharacterized protein (DUF736 family)